ncbi:membrane protein [Mycobacterium sp. SWH-M3]|nr:membrane protein [Mycobacterium sp. SWH-M3]
MGFVKPTLPDVDFEEFLRMPLMERIRIMTTKWADHGLGAPRMIHVLYIVKLVFFYALGGVVVATTTSHLPAFWHVSQWWDQPIVYQKLILWTVLLELIGLAGSWGPLAGKTKPMTGGYRFWAKVNTIRLRPWKAVPFTGGDRRTWFDVIVYLALNVSVVVALVLPGVPSDSLSKVLPDNTSGLVSPSLLIVPMVLLVVIGLRDKTIFLAARGEQYLPALLFFATLPFVDMIIAGKLLIGTVWIWAGISKFGLHFTNVIPPMVSNSPTIGLKWLKRAHYRNYPHDLRPSHLATFMAHGPGSFVEIVAPLALLLSPWPWFTFGAATVMVCFHLFIISTFPLAVPVEWNVLFAYLTVFLFLGFPNWDGYAIADMSSPWLTVALLAGLCFFPVLGNLRPDLVSFLPAMRQYAGNWASAVWTFTPGAEQKLNRVTRSSPNTVDQYIDFGWAPMEAEVFTQQIIAWRALHSQGRGLYSVLLKSLPDIDTRTVREGEMACNTIIGFNFGDGHLHNEDLIAAIQTEAQFEPGEFVVAWVESQPIHKKTQEYKVIDAALGVIERGTWNVADLVDEQPWLPNGPIPLNVTWQRAGVRA